LLFYIGRLYFLPHLSNPETQARFATHH